MSAVTHHSSQQNWRTMKEQDGSFTESTSPSDVEESYPSWHNAVAGGVAGAGSRVLTAPLDLIRIRRQLQLPSTLYPSESILQSFQSVIQTESGGVLALFRGNTAAIFLWIGYAAVQFALYQRTKDAIQSSLKDVVADKRRVSTVSAFLAGATAGTCATVLTYPFDVCRTIFAARGIAPIPVDNHLRLSSLVEPDFRNHYHSELRGPPLSTPQKVGMLAEATPPEPPRTLGDFVHRLYASRGVAGFYAGCGPAIVQIIPYMGLNFAIYDTLTRGDKRVQASAYAGSISGAVSKIIVYPLDTVKRRLQAQAFYSSGDSATIHNHRAKKLPRSTQAAGGIGDRLSRPFSVSSFASSARTSGSFLGASQSLVEAQHEALVRPTQRRYYRGMLHCIRTIYREEGVVAFYRGVTPSVLKTTIASGLSFSLYRGTKNALESIHDVL
jgi:solute carrier family 25 (mitochondrial thiamine pyrophosphate transporter), member 19